MNNIVVAVSTRKSDVLNVTAHCSCRFKGGDYRFDIVWTKACGHVLTIVFENAHDACLLRDWLKIPKKSVRVEGFDLVKKS